MAPELGSQTEGGRRPRWGTGTRVGGSHGPGRARHLVRVTAGAAQLVELVAMRGPGKARGQGICLPPAPVGAGRCTCSGARSTAPGFS